MKKERAQSQDSCKVSGGLGRVCDSQIDIPSVVREGAHPPGIHNSPRSLAAWIGSQAGDDTRVGSGLRTEIDKVERLARGESPSATRTS